MRFRPALFPLSVLACLAASPARADDTPPWMANYEATKGQPVGMDEADVRTFLDKQLKSEWPKEKTWDQAWKQVFLLMTPSWKAEVPAFRLAKYEVSNAQWERFLQDRIDTYETVGDETLEQLSAGLWQLTSDGHITRGWRVLLARNGETLLPVLNPKKDAKWDPMVAQAAGQKLPKGLKLSYPRFLPDATWVDGTGAAQVWGKLPENLRKRPVSFISWEQAADFCSWAGFHLPTELEWEHAARGPEGRWFPWGDTWEPTRCCWKDYNEAALKWNEAAKKKNQSKKPEDPTVAEVAVVMAPGASGEPERTTPCAADVDAFPQGATREGVLNLAGNVSEFTAARAWKYAGSKTTFSYLDGSTGVARGGNYTDRSEIFLAADRNCEGPGGPLLPGNSIEGYGLRLAAYPVAGADLTLPLALRYNDDRGQDTPYFWMPPPVGCADRKSGAQYLGFDPQLTAGILERQLAPSSPDFAFVTGPATGIAFLPIRGVPLEHVKSPAGLTSSPGKDRLVVLGLLAGTAQSGVRVVATAESDGDGGMLGARTVSFSDPRLMNTNEARRDRLLTKEFLGALLALVDGDKVAVYVPNATLSGPAKYRQGLLGNLVHPPVLEAATKDEIAPTATMDGNTAKLSTTIPYLNNKGQPTMNGGSPGIRVTIEVSFVRAVDKSEEK